MAPGADVGGWGPYADDFLAGRAEAFTVGPLSGDGTGSGVCPCGRPHGRGPLGLTFCTCPDGQAARLRFEAVVLGHDAPSAAVPDVPDRLAAVTLHDAVDLPGAEHGRGRAVHAAHLFLDRLAAGERPGAGLCLTGPPGTGKSGVLAALTGELRARGVPVAYAGYHQLIGAVRRHYGGPRASTVELMLGRVPVLALDDLGDPFRSRSTPEETEDKRRIVHAVLDARHGARLPTLLSANYADLDELGEQFDPRVSSRVREMCVEVAVGGPDLRQSPRI